MWRGGDQYNVIKNKGVKTKKRKEDLMTRKVLDCVFSQSSTFLFFGPGDKTSCSEGQVDSFKRRTVGVCSGQQLQLFYLL